MSDVPAHKNPTQFDNQRGDRICAIPGCIYGRTPFNDRLCERHTNAQRLEAELKTVLSRAETALHKVHLTNEHQALPRPTEFDPLKLTRALSAALVELEMYRSQL